MADTAQTEDTTWSRLRDDITGSLKNIRAIDSGALPGYDRAAFVGSIAGKLNRLADNGEVETVEKALEHIRQFDQGRDKPAFTDRHRIWTFPDVARAARGDRSDTIRENETVAAGEGFAIIANYVIDRGQIVFDAKPGDETRTKLKAEGWNWSPSNSAWQRKLTDNAILSARRITGAGGFAQREEARREQQNERGVE